MKKQTELVHVHKPQSLTKDNGWLVSVDSGPGIYDATIFFRATSAADAENLANDLEKRLEI